MNLLRLTLIGLCLSSWTLAAAIAAPALDKADVIISGGRIYTGNPAAPKAAAVAIIDQRIAYVGDEKAVHKFQGPSTKRIDLKGATLLPGLVDAHVHLRGVGTREVTLNLEGSQSIADVRARLAAHLKAHPDDKVIIGRGWIETHWPEARFLTAKDLDDLSGTKPVLLSRADGHALVANSAALALAKITADTQAPDGGQILKDDQGKPTGLLVDHAQSLVASLMAEPAPDQREREVKIGAEVYARYGWTGGHAMSTPYEDLAAMEALAARNELPLRVYAALTLEGLRILQRQGPFSTAPRPGTNGLVTARAVKLYMDGALGSRGAALLEPYSDAPGNGLLLMKHDDAIPIFVEMLKSGVQVATHAIGDRGNRLGLDWYAEAFAAVPPAARAVAEPRWRIEHAQIVEPSDIPRFAKMGVVASMQPSHAIGDLFFAPARLGPARLDGAYAWKSMLTSGAVLAGGSDAPVERGDPMIEFYAAVARRDMKGFQDPKTWHPEQRLSRAQALTAFTLGPAQASFMEKDLGTIEAGKLADMTILDRDILKIEEAEILKTRALMTIVNGRIAYRAQGF